MADTSTSIVNANTAGPSTGIVTYNPTTGATSAGGSVQPIFYVPNNPTTAQIQAVALACFNAGGGVVQLPAGVITLTASLPRYSNVSYNGAGWLPVYTTIPDYVPTQGTVGTWLVGNGSFPAFAGNATSYGGVYPSQVAFSLAAITNAGVSNLAMYNFSYGIQDGSNWTPGTFYTKYFNLLALNCGWGFWFENCIHNSYDKLYAFSNTLGGFRFRSSSSNAIIQPGNSQIGEIVCSQVTGSILQRGIVVSSANGTAGGLSSAQILQSNRFGPGSISQTATLNGTSTVAVTTGSAFAVGLPVAASTSLTNGLVVNQIYFVASVVGNNLTLANYPTGTAVTFSGSGTQTLTSQGFPCIEFVAEDSNAANAASIAFVGVFDVEAGGTTKVIVTKPTGPQWWNAPGVSPSGSTQDFTFRNMNNVAVFLTSANGLNIDTSDGSCGNLIADIASGLGANSQLYVPLLGLKLGANGSGIFNLSYYTGNTIGSGGATFQNTQLGTNDILKMGVPLAELTTPYAGTSLSLSANYGQGLTYSGSTGTTWTLPSITATNNGEKFEICNGATAAVTLTLAAAATQFFNNNSGKTSYALTQFTSISVRAVWGGSTATSFWHIIGNNGAT